LVVIPSEARNLSDGLNQVKKKEGFLTRGSGIGTTDFLNLRHLFDARAEQGERVCG
jgi:hypothetical protein